MGKDFIAYGIQPKVSGLRERYWIENPAHTIFKPVLGLSQRARHLENYDDVSLTCGACHDVSLNGYPLPS